MTLSIGAIKARVRADCSTYIEVPVSQAGHAAILVFTGGASSQARETVLSTFLPVGSISTRDSAQGLSGLNDVVFNTGLACVGISAGSASSWTFAADGYGNWGNASISISKHVSWESWVRIVLLESSGRLTSVVAGSALIAAGAIRAQFAVLSARLAILIVWEGSGKT